MYGYGKILRKKNTEIKHAAEAKEYNWIKVVDGKGKDVWLCLTDGQLDKAKERATKHPEDRP